METQNTYDQASAKIDYTNRQITSMLKSSIAKEENGKKMAQKIVSLEEQNRELRRLIEPLVQEMESHIDRGILSSVQIASDYIKLATYLRDTFKRSDERRIEYAQAWIDSPDSLPY